jgi:hypothetical protein
VCLSDRVSFLLEMKFVWHLSKPPNS